MMVEDTLFSHTPTRPGTRAPRERQRTRPAPSWILLLTLVLILGSLPLPSVVGGQESGGALDSASTLPPLRGSGNGTGPPQVTVALIDTGINPLHEVFEQETLTRHPSTYIAGYPDDSRSLNIDDGVTWSSVQRGQLYWFPGTKIVGAISFGEYSTDTTAEPIRDDYDHGTATSGVVASVNPAVRIVMVETGPFTIDEAMNWTASQPWIDLVSMSVGTLGNVPLPAEVPAHAERAYRQGKLLIAAAGNQPTPTYLSPFAGPPSIIAVGGVEPETRGATLIAAKTPDVVSGFTHRVADSRGEDGYHWNQGTSFAAPTVAGVLSRIVYELRHTTGHWGGIDEGALVHGHELTVTNQEIRDAMNQTASYWDPGAYDPLAYEPSPFDEVEETDGWQRFLHASSAPIVTPPIQVGWGYVDERTVAPAVERLLGNPVDAHPLERLQKEMARPTMETSYDLREAYWTVDPLHGETPEPQVPEVPPLPCEPKCPIAPPGS